MEWVKSEVRRRYEELTRARAIVVSLFRVPEYVEFWVAMTDAEEGVRVSSAMGEDVIGEGDAYGIGDDGTNGGAQLLCFDFLTPVPIPDVVTAEWLRPGRVPGDPDFVRDALELVIDAESIIEM